MIQPNDVISFWLGDPAASTYPENRMKLWFGHGEDTDATIRERFEDAVLDAGDGSLDAWSATPRGRIAVIVLIDQFTRNIYRGSGEMYRFDHRALALAKAGIEADEHRELHMFEKLFLYLPLEHAEDLASQEQSVALFEQLVQDAPSEDAGMVSQLLDYAVKHRDIVARFGRFPHRNTLLDRASTPEEVEFLKGPGSSF